jgi:hypothetical protein
MKTHKETRGIALLIVNLGTRWMWDLSSRPGRFTPGKGPQYPLNKGLILVFLFPVHFMNATVAIRYKDDYTEDNMMDGTSGTHETRK